MNRFNKYFSNEQLPQRVAWAVVFAFIFSIMGRIIPDSYYRYLDTTKYLHIDSPVNVDKSFFKPCENVVLTTSLYALTDIEVVILNQLVLVRDDGNEYQIPSSLIELRAPIRKSAPHTVSYPFPLPCDLEAGRYFWKGTMVYQYKEVERVVGFISQTFNVAESGVPIELEPLLKDAN